MGMIPCCEAGHNIVNFYLIQHKSYHKYILWGRQNLYIVILFNSCKTNCRRRVAQFGRALRSGRRGRRFKSCRIDEEETSTLLGVLVFYMKISTQILSGIILSCYNERKQVNI